MTTVFSQCLACIHYRIGVPPRCAAFPDTVIPSAIIFNEHDHRLPFPGDNGVRWEPDTIGGRTAKHPMGAPEG